MAVQAKGVAWPWYCRADSKCPVFIYCILQELPIGERWQGRG